VPELPVPDLRSYLLVAAVAATAAALFADYEGSYLVPLDQGPIRYSSTQARDAVAEFDRRLQEGAETLEYHPDFGYLPALLRKFQVPVSSQVLVFSKTSFQAARISPRLPRAIYFNQQVSLGWVRGGDVVELAAIDPELGTIFYTVDQEPGGKPRMKRRDDCLQCHHAGATAGVPGLLVRSVYPDRSGLPVFRAGSFITDHRSPLKERWGGWYVTGTHADPHLGNVLLEDSDDPASLDLSRGANLTDLKDRFDTGAYLSPHSDIVALMVLEHQTRMTNLLTRASYETRIALEYQKGMDEALGKPSGEFSDSVRRRIHNAAEAVVKYLLFAEEAPLQGPVKGTSSFAKEFTASAPVTKDSRSFSQLDLEKRLLKYPCSPMIYSELFDRLPWPLLERIHERLWQVLSGADSSPTYARLTEDDRRAILEILIETKSGLPEFWKPALQDQARTRGPAARTGTPAALTRSTEGFSP
jgi:hypothetical protein